jgi:2-dehydro-3-deoxyphosphogluconate aldolase / (4S)-4-hydroxy-2-oxoglutarate aldolase
MSASETTAQIVAAGIVAIIRLPSPVDLLPVAAALRDGGLCAIEFALTSSGALSALELARTQFGRGVRLGAGMVLTAEQAHDALRAGAEFLTAPAINLTVIRAARTADVAVVSGAFTPTEIIQAYEAGASLVRVFPVGSVGPRYIQDLQGPLSHIPLMPTGGVTLENAGAFIHAGAVALGVGDDPATRDLLERRDFRGITARVREFADAVASARGRDTRPAPSVKPIEGPDTR